MTTFPPTSRPFAVFRNIVASLALCAACSQWAAAQDPAPAAPAASAPSARELLEQAVRLDKSGDRAGAIPLYENVLQLDPTILSAWESLGWAYWNVNRRADAVDLWNRLMAITPNHPLPHNLLAKAAAADGDFDKAVSLARKSLSINPDQPAVRYDLARFLLWNSELEESTTLLDQALKASPDRQDIRLDLARSLSNQNLFDQALPLWRELAAKQPDQDEFVAMEGLCLLHHNEASPARDRFGVVLKRSPKHPVALEGMANLEEFGAEPAKAIPYLRDLLEAQSDSSNQESVRVRLINLLLRLHRLNPLEHTLNEPRALVEDRLEYNPDSVDALLSRAELHLMDLKYVEAETGFIRVLKDYNPHNLRARKGLFETYLAAKRFPQAREQFAQIRAFNPLDPYLDYLLARLESTQGNFPAAFEALDRLEAAGRRGAVAVVLHHGLAPSHFLPEAIPLDLFRERLDAMRAAGFQFVKSGAIPELFASATNNVEKAKSDGKKPGPSAKKAPAKTPPSPPKKEAKPAPAKVPVLPVRPSTPQERSRLAPTPALSIRLPETLTPTNPPVEPPPAADPDDSPAPAATLPPPTTNALPIQVSINFDDGRKDILRLATPIALEYGIVFSHHIPPGYILMNHPFIASWQQMAEYSRTGAWEFGSHFLNAAVLAPISPSNRVGRTLFNLKWLPEANRMETPEEYAVRLHDEFGESQRMLREHTGQRVNFISYPFGDIGQETDTNLINPAPVITQAGRPFYDAAFLQSSFGFAVAGDDPMYYQRHEMARWMTGSNVVEYIYANHPVYLARRLRAEYAALDGKQYRAMDNVAWLEKNGYPPRLVEETERYVRDRLSGGYAAPTKAAAKTKSAWDVDALKPRLRAEGEVFSDNQDRSHSRINLGGGLNLGERLAIDARAGTGRFEQDVPALGTVGPYSLSATEQSIGARATLLFVPDRDRPVTDLYPNYLSVGATQRTFSGDADGSVMALEAETQFRPILPLDLMLRFESDIVPTAKALVEETTYDAGLVSATYRLRDWWELRASGAHYGFSDDNTRDHLGVGTHWLLHERSGFGVGLRYAYATADEDRQAYWTPFQLHRYMAEAQFRGSYRRTYYNLRAYAGLGHEDVRPEDEQRYRETLERARIERWRVSDIGEPPSSDWEPVFGFSASTRIRLRDRLELNAEASYNESPNYNELTLQGGISFFFY